MQNKMPDPDPGELRNALEAVREALDIPHAATVGDEETRTAILLERVRHTVVMLGSVLREDPVHLPWHVAYLRDRLAEHPDTGYRTWDEAMADLRAREDGTS
jgi:hypothetical protein